MEEEVEVVEGTTTLVVELMVGRIVVVGVYRGQAVFVGLHLVMVTVLVVVAVMVVVVSSAEVWATATDAAMRAKMLVKRILNDLEDEDEESLMIQVLV